MNIPYTRYSKSDLCYLLMDPTTNLNNPGCARRISAQTLKSWIIKADLLPALGITEEDYNKLKSFSYTQSKVILDRFL